MTNGPIPPGDGDTILKCDISDFKSMSPFTLPSTIDVPKSTTTASVTISEELTKFGTPALNITI